MIVVENPPDSSYLLYRGQVPLPAEVLTNLQRAINNKEVIDMISTMSLMSGIGGTSSLDVHFFLAVIVELSMYLFIVTAFWLFCQWIGHHSLVFSFRRSMKSFYRGLAKLGDKESFPDWVEHNFDPMTNKWRRLFAADLFLGLLTGNRDFRRHRNRVHYQTRINQLRVKMREVFSQDNLRALSLQLTTALFVLVMFLYDLYFSSEPLPPLLTWGVLLFIVSAVWLYISKEKQGNRAVKEVDKLETVYANYLHTGEMYQNV
jgi:hypothetical protein